MKIDIIKKLKAFLDDRIEDLNNSIAEAKRLRLDQNSFGMGYDVGQIDLARELMKEILGENVCNEN